MAEAQLNSVYDEQPEQYDQLRQCWLNERRLRFIDERLAAYQLQSNSSVLEIGSGTGLLLRSLASRWSEVRFTGLEPQETYVRYAESASDLSNLNFRQGTAESARTDISEPQNVILSNDVLHHVESLHESVESLTRISAPATRWLLIEPNCKNPYAFLGQSLKSGEKNFWPGQFRKLARQFNWRVERSGYLFLIPPFVSRPPRWAITLERLLEGVPVLGGGAYMELVLESGTTS